MKKQKSYYLINVCHGGTADIIRCETKKEKNKWLFNYFTTGEEKMWAWEKYKQSHQTDFHKFVKKLLKESEKQTVQSFLIRKGKVIIIQEKNK